MPMDQSYGDGEDLLQPADYELEPLREDKEFILCRGRYLNQVETSFVLLRVPVLKHPADETFKKIDHIYSLRNELDGGWAVRPFTLSRAMPSRYSCLRTVPTSFSIA